jgi:hypothetical protein
MHYNSISNAAAGRTIPAFPSVPDTRTLRPAASVLSKSELRRIVAEILG